MPIHPPYTYTTLLADLEKHRDLVTALGEHLYVTEPECTWRRLARARAFAPDQSTLTLYFRTMCWSCYLHPTTNEELTEYFRSLVKGWEGGAVSEHLSPRAIEQEIARPSSIRLVNQVFLRRSVETSPPTFQRLKTILVTTA